MRLHDIIFLYYLHLQKFLLLPNFSWNVSPTFIAHVRKTAGDLQFVIFVGQVKSLVSFVSGVLYVNWRGSLTRFIHKFYFAQDNYYELNVLQRDIDNLWVVKFYISKYLRKGTKTSARKIPPSGKRPYPLIAMQRSFEIFPVKLSTQKVSHCSER
jgi:ABC-type uncharacterized transport system fused permease/ATPase subunit